MDQFILFGDSITRYVYNTQIDGFNLGAELHDAYGGRLDVINRGHSGYNTTQALAVLPRIIPAPSQARVRLLAIFFGANDARMPNLPPAPDQCVPLENYRENMHALIHHPAIRAHSDIKLVLITPPPLEERLNHAADLQRCPELGDRLKRSSENAAKYAQVVREVGTSEGIPVVDVWTAMMSRAGVHSHNSDPAAPMPGSLGAPLNDTLQRFLPDGLHLSGYGYRVIFDELMAVIEKRLPQLMPCNISPLLPVWDDVEAWKEMLNG